MIVDKKPESSGIEKTLEGVNNELLYTLAKQTSLKCTILLFKEFSKMFYKKRKYYLNKTNQQIDEVWNKLFYRYVRWYYHIDLYQKKR